MTSLPAVAILIGASRIRIETMALTPEQERLWRAELEKSSVAQIRSELERNTISSAYVHLTSQWLAEKDREAERKADSWASEARDLARSANEVALEANSIARDSASSARRSADAARRSNMIATLALIAAMVAIAISSIGLFFRR
jgi:hypothetical protein